MRLLLVILFCILAIGCRSDQRCQRQTALLRAEILDLEDKYYSLKSKQDAAGLGNEVFENEIIGEPYYEGEVIYEGEAFYDGDVLYEGEFVQDGQYANNGGVSFPGNGVNQNPVPVESQNGGAISIVAPFTNSGAENPNPSGASRAGSSETQNSSQPQTNSDVDPLGLQLNAAIDVIEIAEIRIEPSLTRGRDIDGRPGDEGLDLFVQPTTSDGRIEYQAGELTVSLIDPAQAADRQRIGLWKFLAAETKLFYANDNQGKKGILLHLPWD